MKLHSVSKKSFIIYLAVFFILLLFEANRLTPYLEREGAEYPILQKANIILQDIGNTSGIYAFSNRLHDEFDYVAKHPLFSDLQNISPYLKKIFTQTKEQELASNEITQAPKKQEIPSKPVVAEKIENQTQIAKKLTTEYTYNSLNYPYNASLAKNPENANALGYYTAQIPDFGKKKTVLLIGDSMMMEGLGPTLHHSLRKRDNLEVYREGKYSSGLSRPDFFDWNANIVTMLEKYNPDLLIMSLGANDTQDIVIDKKRYFIDTKAWSEIYLQRSKDFVALADNGKRHIIWVSLPVMGKEPYFSRVKVLTTLQEEASKSIANCQFVNIQHLLTDKNGKYTTFYKDKNNQSIRLRSQDLIHVSTAGGEILTKYVTPYVDKELNALYAEEIPFIYPPVAGKANIVRFTSEFRQKEVEYVVWLPETATPLAEKTPMPVDTAKSIHEQLANKKYPVLYLLHGAYDNAFCWDKNIGKKLQDIANTKKIIIVAPSSEEFGWYVDSPLKADNQIASFLIKELIPHIDTLYPTNKKRGIIGLSMGGHGALLTGFKNQSLFQSMASVSGVLDIRLHQDNWKIKDLLGIMNEENQKNWDNNSVLATIGYKWPATSPRHITIVTGDKDMLVLDENRKAKELLTKRGFKFEYREENGNHDWAFWQKHIVEIMAKQADYLNSL